MRRRPVRVGHGRPRPRAALAVVVLAVALSAVGAGCGSGEGGSAGDASTTTEPPTTAPPGGLTTEVLDGHAYVSRQVTGHDLVAGTAIRLSFDGSTMGAGAGCNSLSGRYAVSGGTLRWAGDVAMTEMGCDPDREAQDRWLVELLTSGAQAVLEGDNLVLRAGDVTVALVDEQAANPDRPLVGTAWSLDTLIDGETASSVPSEVSTPTLAFTDDGRVAVFTGCNRGTATVTVAADGTGATFGPLALTRMSCGDSASSVEAAVAAVLDGEVGLAIDGASLTITKGEQALTYRAT